MVKKRSLLFLIMGVIFGCLLSCGIFAAVASSINFSLVMKLNPTIYFALDLQIDENGDGEFTTANELKIHRIFDNTPENGTHASWAIVNMSRIVLQNTGLAENPFTGLTNSAVFKITVTNLTTAEQQGVEENSPELKNLWLSLNPADFSGMYTLPESGVQNVAYGTSKSILVYPDMLTSEYFEIPFKVELKTATYDHNIVLNIAEDACPVNDNVEIKWQTPQNTVTNGHNFTNKMLSDYDAIPIESVQINGVDVNYTYNSETLEFSILGNALTAENNDDLIITIKKVGYKLLPGLDMRIIMNAGVTTLNEAPATITEVTFDFDGDKYNTIKSAPNYTKIVNQKADVDLIKVYIKDNKTYVLSNYNIFLNENASHLFYYYKSLLAIIFTNLNTDITIDMNRMFFECNVLDGVNMANFNTSKVVNMTHMFFEYGGKKIYGITTLDTGQVSDMSYMFADCYQFGMDGQLNIMFNTSRVTNMGCMFRNCYALTKVNSTSSGHAVFNFDTSNVTNMSYMFQGCTGLTSLDLSNFDTSNVTNMSYMFYGCTVLTSLDISNFNTSKVTDMSYMFNDCNQLTSLDVSDFDTSNVTDMSYMFRNCTNLARLHASNFDTSNIISMSHMFYGCKQLIELDVSNFDTSKVTNMHCMFDQCFKLTNVDLLNFDTSNVTTMRRMFASCYLLTELNLSTFITQNVTTMNGIFGSCTSLKTIYVSENFVTTNVTDSTNMFGDCTSLVGGNGTAYSSSYLDKTYARIDTAGTPGYFTKWVG